MKGKNTLSCSEATKLKIGLALKELMKTTQFEKITVSDITDKCNIHRQTFYYHFQDRYDLLDWLLYNELLSKFIEDFSIDTMYDKFHMIFDIISNDKKFFQSAFKINMNDMSKYICNVSTEEFTNVIRDIGKANGINQPNIDDQLIAEFFGYGLGGVVISWVSRGMKETPDEMTQKIKAFTNVCTTIITDRNK